MKGNTMKLNVERTGGNGPVLVLSNSLGTNLHMWDEVLPQLRQHFDVIRYDQRGHGKSEPVTEGYGVAELGADVIGILDNAGVDKAYFCGVSMGGQTGLWLAANQPERFHGVIVSNTAPKIGAADSWNTRIETVNSQGIAPIADAVAGGWVSAQLRESDPELFASLRDGMLLTTDAGSYAFACGAVRDCDLTEQIAGIAVPLLAIGGTHDGPTPAAVTRATIADVVPGASFVEVPAAHVSPIEAPDAYARAVIDFAGSVQG
jgi:3-oxoadipate enol-lactonase